MMVCKGFGLSKELLGERELTLMLGFFLLTEKRFLHGTLHALGGLSDNTWSYVS